MVSAKGKMEGKRKNLFRKRQGDKCRISIRNKVQYTDLDLSLDLRVSLKERPGGANESPWGNAGGANGSRAAGRKEFIRREKKHKWEGENGSLGVKKNERVKGKKNT